MIRHLLETFGRDLAQFGIFDEAVTSWILSDGVTDLAEQSEPLATVILEGLLRTGDQARPKP